MAKYRISGATELRGKISAGGSKNAALPIICATLLTGQKCVLSNVPDISDVRNLIKILQQLGSKIIFESGRIEIDNSTVHSHNPDPKLVSKMRASILLLGPLLSRFGRVEMPMPGGDKIGKRPIDAHIVAFKELGAEVLESEKLVLSADKLSGKKIIMTEMSVTATENIIMAAVLAKGRSTIHLAATEPHVQDLCNFLNKAGAKISGIGTHNLAIEGVEKLSGAEHKIISDSNVACSFINLAAATRSELTVDEIDPEFLNAELIQFSQMNVRLEVSKNSITVKKPSGDYQAFKIVSNIYPGLPTDSVPPFAVLATQASGTTIIHEWMYEGRLGYIHELAKMGAKAKIIDQNHAEISGPTKLHGSNVSSLDIRSGMVMVIAALVAEGESILHDIEHVERGYEHIVEKLKSIGANIERID